MYFLLQVKTVTKIKVRENKTRVPLRVFDRKNLPRFGEAKLGEETVTLHSVDFVSMEHPDDQQEEDADDPTLSKTLANFMNKQAETNLRRENDYSLDDDNAPSGGDAGDGDKAGKYVAPGSRAGASSMGGGFDSGKSDKDGTENTIRVSNLTKAVTEDDLRELFERFGFIHRVSLPKIERYDETLKMTIKEPRGFAYIAYANHEDAEKAMNRLQGYGYDHLIIKLEWAKPTKDGGGGGGGERNFMSGYGKQLAQDTTDKVYYASNLTGNR